jgi:uncharacterized membrane protein YfcA
MVSVSLLVLLALFGFVGGVGITALGPGGVIPTIGLFALTSLSPPEVAGTALVTYIAAGVLGTAAYTRSGQLREPDTRRTALILAATALLGTPVGVLANTAFSRRTFGVLLGIMVALVAVLVWYREHRRPAATPTQPQTHPPPHPPAPVIAALGLAVAAVSGAFGVGGPMFTVPLLVALGMRVLESLAAAQVQSVVIASVGAVGYLAAGAVSWPLVALVGIPELAGVLLGWKIAHALPTRHLKNALIIALLVLAPYLALRS